MTQPYDPNTFAPSLPVQHKQWVQSTQQVLTGNVDMGTATAQSAESGVNKGVYTQFKKGNGSGILIRIAANGVANSGASYNWAGTSVGISINHGLGRQPIGFHVVDQDKAVQVFRTAPPDDQTLTLAPSDNTASVTIYVF